MEWSEKQIKEMQALAEETLMQFKKQEPQPLAIPAAWYPSWINIPEGKAGKMQVVHRTLTGTTPIIGARQAMLRGVRPASADLTKLPKGELVVHQLLESGGVWMTDMPEELFQIEEAIARFKPEGDVLVGGLGLGLLAVRLCYEEDVYSVTVVERNKNVIKLCAPEDEPTMEIIHGDVFKVLEKNPKEFDCYMLDTWAGTNESTYWSDVFPQRRIIRNRFNMRPKIWCWAEDIMRGQVGSVITRQSQTDHWYYKGIPMMEGEELTWFFDQVGSKEWERKFGKLPFKGYDE